MFFSHLIKETTKPKNDNDIRGMHKGQVKMRSEFFGFVECYESDYTEVYIDKNGVNSYNTDDLWDSIQIGTKLQFDIREPEEGSSKKPIAINVEIIE